MRATVDFTLVNRPVGTPLSQHPFYRLTFSDHGLAHGFAEVLDRQALVPGLIMDAVLRLKTEEYRKVPGLLLVEKVRPQGHVLRSTADITLTVNCARPAGAPLPLAPEPAHPELCLEPYRGLVGMEDAPDDIEDAESYFLPPMAPDEEWESHSHFLPPLDYQAF